MERPALLNFWKHERNTDWQSYFDNSLYKEIQFSFLKLKDLLTENVNNTYIAFMVLFGINMSGGKFQKSVVTRLPQQKGERYVQEDNV